MSNHSGIKRIGVSALSGEPAHSELKPSLIPPVSTSTDTQESQPKVRTVLLVGETGSGKSTIVNCLANYFLGGDLRNLKILVPNKVYRRQTEPGFAEPSEANIDDPTLSQTQKCAMYEFQKNDAVYRFIDTPGLCDYATTGVRGDTDTINTILASAGQAGELHAILTVINGSIPKLTLNLKCALEQLASNYPNALYSNLLVVFTNSCLVAPNFDLDCLPCRPKQYFTMNNLAFGSRSGDWDPEESWMQEKCWNKGMRSMDAMVNFIEGMQPQPTNVFNSILENRNKIKSGLLNVIVEVENLENFQTMKESIKGKWTASQREMQQRQVEVHRINREQRYVEDKVTALAQVDEIALRNEQELKHQLEAKWDSLCRAVGEVDSRQSRSQHQFQASDFETIARLVHDCRMSQEALDARVNRRVENQETWSQPAMRPNSAHMRTNKAGVDTHLAAAKEAHDEFQAQLEKVESLQSEAENRLKKAQAEVEHTLLELKSTCSDFNGIEELAQAKEVLAGSLKSLKTEKGRKYVVGFIESLEKKWTPAEVASNQHVRPLPKPR